MSRPLATFLLAAVTLASVALWFDQAIRRGFRDLRIETWEITDHVTIGADE